MAQPQLDIPPISFARYLDLLKRRRWQVVPISIAGLVIGAIVAFLIPRYYVARTTIQFRGQVIGVDSSAKDPMESLIESAEITIRWSALRPTLAELGWADARSGTQDEQRAFEDKVRSRIAVVDMGPRGERRATANLLITYKDTDGQRAMELTNKLRDVWLEEQKEKLAAESKGALDDSLEQVDRAHRAVVDANREVHNFEVEFDINPQDWIGKSDGGVSDLSKERSSVFKSLKDTETELKKLRAQLEVKKEKLAQTRPTIEQRIEAELPESIGKLLDELQAQIVYLQIAIKGMKPQHPHYDLKAAQLTEATDKLVEMKKLLEIDDLKEVTNPDYAELLEEIDEIESEIAAKDAEVASSRGYVAQLDEDLDKLPQIGRDYRELQRKLEEAQSLFDDLQERQREVEERRAQLMKSQAYEVLDYASVPPRPTEPNITLVALAGSAVGLAVAIGLILLIDIVQSTFKTVEDVEHVLPIPVLGGISHMETLEHKRSVHQRRTRAGLVAGAFLLLTVSVITIYYVWPSRLPPVVRTTLDMILGAPQTDSVK